MRLQRLQQRLLEFVLVWRLELWRVLVLLLQLLPQEPGLPWWWIVQPEGLLPRQLP